MVNNIVSFLVIACLATTALLAIFTISRNRAKIRAAQETSSKVESWMKAQAYLPDHFNFFHATAIAIKDGDNRILLHGHGTTKFYPLSDLISFRTYESVERSRPLGAAPGVVELNAFLRFNLDITLKNARTPFKILFENKALLSEWETRLNALTGADKQG